MLEVHPRFFQSVPLPTQRGLWCLLDEERSDFIIFRMPDILDGELYVMDFWRVPSAHRTKINLVYFRMGSLVREKFVDSVDDLVTRKLVYA